MGLIGVKAVARATRRVIRLILYGHGPSMNPRSDPSNPSTCPLSPSPRRHKGRVQGVPCGHGTAIRVERGTAAAGRTVRSLVGYCQKTRVAR